MKQIQKPSGATNLIYILVGIMLLFTNSHAKAVDQADVAQSQADTKSTPRPKEKEYCDSLDGEKKGPHQVPSPFLYLPYSSTSFDLNSWRRVADMPIARTQLAAVAAPNGKIYAIGGANSLGNPISSVERYTGSSATFQDFTIQGDSLVSPIKFTKSSPANGATSQPLSLTLAWQSTLPNSWFQYCYDTSNDNMCSNWTNTGINSHATLSGLIDNTTYYWHVRAWNKSNGLIYSDGSSAAFWSFSTRSSAPGGLITFSSSRDGNLEIYRMSSDGTGLARLTQNAWQDWSPVWSPDGQRIAYFSDVNGGHEIYIMNADGSNQRRLSLSPALDYDPSWSPDGNHLAFNSARDGNHEIYVVNADGSNPTRLTNNNSTDYHAAWSPDGKLIAFTSERDGFGEIYIMRPDGSRQTRLTTNSANDWGPTWSQDSASIVFVSNRDGNQEIYRMNADGSSQTRLTFDPASDFDPAWANFGSQIIFSSERNGAPEIYIMNLDGSGLTNLTNDPATDLHPSYFQLFLNLLQPVFLQ